MDTIHTDKHDIENRTDIAHLIRTFYTRAMQDDTIGYLFTDVARINLEEHLPVMYDFWENVLFQAGVYRGGMMMKHIVLNQKSPLRQEHFDRWLALFTQTLDELYSGPTTEEARRRAYLVANTIRTRLNPGSHSLLSPQNSKRAAN